MESTSGSTSAGLIEELANAPWAFDFFRAVRLLETAAADRPRIGASKHPREDPVRFGQNPFLSFAPSTLDEFQVPDQGLPKLMVRFFGLFGPNGPLPLHFTQQALEHQHARLAGRKFAAQEAAPQQPAAPRPERGKDQRALLDFYDIFHHRLISLFYRAWAMTQKTVDFDRGADMESSGTLTGDAWSGPRFALYLGATFGLGMEALRNRGPIPDTAKIFFAGRLSCLTRNAEGLQAILGQYFEVPAKLEPFFGKWLDLPADYACRLGDGTNAQLGKSAHLGQQFWDRQTSFRVRLGPMKLRDFNRFLPRERGFQHLQGWIVGYIGQELSWDLQLVLDKDEVPACVLGQGGQLGWNTWLKSQPFPRDAEDAVLSGDHRLF